MATVHILIATESAEEMGLKKTLKYTLSSRISGEPFSSHYVIWGGETGAEVDAQLAEFGKHHYILAPHEIELDEQMEAAFKAVRAIDGLGGENGDQAMYDLLTLFFREGFERGMQHGAKLENALIEVS